MCFLCSFAAFFHLELAKPIAKKKNNNNSVSQHYEGSLNSKWLSEKILRIFFPNIT